MAEGRREGEYEKAVAPVLCWFAESYARSWGDLHAALEQVFDAILEKGDDVVLRFRGVVVGGGSLDLDYVECN